MIKTIKDIKEIDGFNKIASALLTENNIVLNDEDDFKKLFPDQYTECNFETYLNEMAPLKEVQKFVDMIKEHDIDEEICIYGDYDVDGIMATVIAHHALSELGFSVHFNIPNRLTEGYGQQNLEADVANNGTKLAITVDNGASSKSLFERAQALGVKLLVTDHHIPEPGAQPDCVTIDPIANGDEFAGICGATVILKCVYELYKEMAPNKMNVIYDLVPLAGLATVTDMMPLIGENRILVNATLNEINRLKNANIRNSFQKILFALGGYNFFTSEDSKATEELIGFNIGPVINAVSRVTGDVRNVVDSILLLLSSPQARVKSFESFNSRRKMITEDLMEDYEYDTNYKNISVFIYDENNYMYSIKGIIGLIANKVSKKYNVVTLIGHQDKDPNFANFSGRSLAGYNLNEGINRIKDAHPEFEISGGGHAQAMGVRIKNTPEIMEEFKKLLEEDVVKNSSICEETIYEFDPDYYDEIVDTLSELQPYGESWQKLKFTYKGILNSFDRDTKYAEINGYYFRIFVKELDKYIGKEVEVEFNVLFDSYYSDVTFQGTLKK